MKRLLLLSAFLAIASTAFAQAEGPGPKGVRSRPEATPKIVYEKHTNVDFTEPATIQGRVPTPWGAMYIHRSAQAFPDMVEERGNFRPELARSLP